MFQLTALAIPSGLFDAAAKVTSSWALGAFAIAAVVAIVLGNRSKARQGAQFPIAALLVIVTAVIVPVAGAVITASFLQPTPPPVKPEPTAVKLGMLAIQADSSLKVYVDDTFLANLKKGEVTTTAVTFGKHVVQAKSDNPTAVWEQQVTVKDSEQILVETKLAPRIKSASEEERASSLAWLFPDNKKSLVYQYLEGCGGDVGRFYLRVIVTRFDDYTPRNGRGYAPSRDTRPFPYVLVHLWDSCPGPGDLIRHVETQLDGHLEPDEADSSIAKSADLKNIYDGTEKGTVYASDYKGAFDPTQDLTLRRLEGGKVEADFYRVGMGYKKLILELGGPDPR